MTDYVGKLAEETFRLIGDEKGPLLEIVLNSSFKTRPPDAGALAGELQSRADVQARLASLTEYTPSKWLLEQELEQVEQRRAKFDMHPPDAAESAADTYKRPPIWDSWDSASPAEAYVAPPSILVFCRG